jgi:hypothetical protein
MGGILNSACLASSQSAAEGARKLKPCSMGLSCAWPKEPDLTGVSILSLFGRLSVACCRFCFNARRVFKAPKSRSSRRVLPIAPELLSILNEHRSKQASQASNDLVFSEGGSPWAPDTFSKQFAGIMRRVGITGFRLHDTRHAFASLTLSNGSSVKEVSALLGHASATMTLSTYAHVIAGMGREAVNGLAKSLLTGPDTPDSKC